MSSDIAHKVARSTADVEHSWALAIPRDDLEACSGLAKALSDRQIMLFRVSISCLDTACRRIFGVDQRGSYGAITQEIAP